jgi:hypothetical protein
MDHHRGERSSIAEDRRADEAARVDMRSMAPRMRCFRLMQAPLAAFSCLAHPQDWRAWVVSESARYPYFRRKCDSLSAL